MNPSVSQEEALRPTRFPIGLVRLQADEPGPLPFLCLNLAMTADGKITSANRRISGFSSRVDQQHMLELRVTADAVMSGARTVDHRGLAQDLAGDAELAGPVLEEQRELTELHLPLLRCSACRGRASPSPRCARSSAARRGGPSRGSRRRGRWRSRASCGAARASRWCRRTPRR